MYLFCCVVCIILVQTINYNQKRVCVFLSSLNSFRKDRLWIAMEFCGGGSLQDIYHGNQLINALTFINFSAMVNQYQYIHC